MMIAPLEDYNRYTQEDLEKQAEAGESITQILHVV